MVTEAVYESCRQAARKMLQRYHWQLLSEAELTQQLVRHTQGGALTSEGLERIVLTLWSIALYQACRQRDREQQIKAFTDLSQYFYNVAHQVLRYDPETASDLTQSALEEVWRRREEAQSPETFLKFCMLCLKHARTNHQRQQYRSRMDESLSVAETDHENAEIERVDVAAQTPEQSALCIDLYERLLHSFEQIQKARKRAERQLEALYQAHVLGLSDQEIAEQLQATVDQVHVLKSRGRKLLCGDTEFVALFRELATNCRALGKIGLFS